MLRIIKNCNFAHENITATFDKSHRRHQRKVESLQSKILICRGELSSPLQHNSDTAADVNI